MAQLQCGALSSTGVSLKKLQSMPILFGQIVHRYIEQAINDYLQTGKAPTVEELIQLARGQLNAAFIDSTRRLEFWRQNRINTI